MALRYPDSKFPEIDKRHFSNKSQGINRAVANEAVTWFLIRLC